MEFAALIFDCDGTLTDSMPVHFLAWQQTMQGYGIGFTEERFYALGGMPTDRIIRLLADETGIVIDALAAARAKEAAFLQFLQRVQPIQAVCDLVLAHHGKRKMAVASGGWRDVVTRQLEHIGLLPYFDTIVTAEDTERHKPEPDVFLEAARRLEVAPQDCMVYEDSELGFEAARRAGMQWTDVRSWYPTARRSAASPPDANR